MKAARLWLTCGRPLCSRMERVTRAIIGSGCGRSAADLYSDMDRLSRLKVCPLTEL